MNNVCNIDTKELDDILNNLNERNRKEAIFNSLVKGGNILVKETQSELLSVLPKANRGERYGKPMTKGVKLKKDKDYNEVKVHIMGDYRLKFFEMGTDDRYLKKPLSSKSNSSNKKNDGNRPYRGKIIGKEFFKKTRETTKIITIVVDNLINELNKLFK